MDGWAGAENVKKLLCDRRADRRTDGPKSGLKSRVSATKNHQLVLCLSECVGKGRGEAEGWMPLPTHLQRYCDPVSLVDLSTCDNHVSGLDFFIDLERKKKKKKSDRLIKE